MIGPILLATDLDRTLLPNGKHTESPLARPLFRQFVTRPEVQLVYVTGRDRALVIDAIAQYKLPSPQYVITDVGTRIYQTHGGDWHLSEDWHQTVSAGWRGCSHVQLAAELETIPALRLQEAAKQSALKLSFYAAPLRDPTALLTQVRERIARIGTDSHLVWSIDETTDTGLLDVLPAGASKLQALEFLRQQLGISLSNTVFAGDSGNDMEVLVSEIPSVLVANADDGVRAEAVERAHAASLYLAQGGLAEMNGHYSAGILEGVVHFIPSTRAWLGPEHSSAPPSKLD